MARKCRNEGSGGGKQGMFPTLLIKSPILNYLSAEKEWPMRGKCAECRPFILAMTLTDSVRRGIEDRVAYNH
jgi:hypothetical protein